MYNMVNLLEIEVEIGSRSLLGKFFIFADFLFVSRKTKNLLKE